MHLFVHIHLRADAILFLVFRFVWLERKSARQKISNSNFSTSIDCIGKTKSLHPLNTYSIFFPTTFDLDYHIIFISHFISDILWYRFEFGFIFDIILRYRFDFTETLIIASGN